MSCPCGSTKCTCDEGCFCHQINCQCNKCELLPKICPRCGLPFNVFSLKENYEHQVCSCDKQEHPFYLKNQSYLQTTTSARSYQPSVTPVRTYKCPRCNLPIFIVAADGDFQRRVRSCCCSNKNQNTNNSDLQSEYETSNSTSDHREVSADRQVRKILSRKIRTEKSNWQAKKVKEHSSNSAEECSSNTEIADTEAVFADTSIPSLFHAIHDEESKVSCAGPSGNVMDDVQSVNPDSHTLSPTGISSRADDTSTGNVSLLVNTSGFSSPCIPEALSHFEKLGLMPSNQNIRAKLPQPFPRLPKPIPGPPAFGRQPYRSPHLNPRTRPFSLEQPAVAEKMEKWFETIQNVLDTSGELPDAETAATLDRMDKEHSEVEQISSYSGAQPVCDPIVTHLDNDKGQEDIEPTTDTDRSTTLSKSHKESESD